MLNHVFSEVRDGIAKEKTGDRQITHSSLLEWVTSLGLAHSVPVEGKSFYLVEVGASADAEVDPLELLMADKPTGVICYFSAVAFHALTTQVVAHHHVAELQPASEKTEERPSVTELSEESIKPTTTATPTPRAMGSLLFRYKETPYYLTRRSSRLVPGIQTRSHGPRTRIRITTLEQTLLDTLYKPFSCGGPGVVLEAWQGSLTFRNLDEERLVEYLKKMNYPATARRLGAMLELVGYAPGKELQQLLETCQATVNREGQFARISLLPGVHYENINDRWLVAMP